MPRKTIQVELPRRVAAYYLLFCIAAAVWFTMGAVEAARGILSSRSESVCLSRLSRAAASLGLEVVRHGPANLQAQVERIQRQGSLAYCAVVGQDGRYLAHSTSSMVGRRFRDAGVDCAAWGDIQRAGFVDAQGRAIREYRTPLNLGGHAMGSLHLAVRDPSWAETIRLAAEHAPLATLGGIFFVVLGALVVYRTVRPLSEIDRQLRQLARAGAVSEAKLRPVPSRSAASMGWNRLVRQQERGRTQGSLKRRVSQAVEGIAGRKSDAILNSLSDGLIVTDAEGRIEFANEAVAALLDRGPDGRSLQGEPIESCLSFAKGQSEAAVLFDDQLRARTAVAEVSRADSRGGQTLRVARHPRRSSQRNSATGHVWSIRDVTQQKLAEAMRDQFLDSATHELRTPLANIKAYAETLTLSEMADVEMQKQFCNTINSEATRLARLIDDLLSVSSMEVGSLSLNRREVNLERLLRECVEKVRGQMEKKDLVLETVLPEKLPAARLDKDKIAACLVNLLGNAAKYTPAGGRVTLRVRSDQERLKIDVEDTGVGISEEDLPRVFDKFFRSSDARVQAEAGSGLGLAFSQEVVRLHDGVLTVKSRVNEGSTFALELPLA